GGQVRTGGMPTRPTDGDLHEVRGGGQRTGPYADVAHRDLRRAVQAEDGRDAGQGTGADDIVRPGRELLLGGLEQQPYPSGELTLLGQPGQGQARAEDDRRVYVVPARVAGALDGRPVGHVLDVGHRQRVEVGAQRDHRPALADVADHAVALGQEPRREAGDRQLPGDQRGGLEL